MYTFLDSAMYLHSKTQYVFFEKKYTSWYQIIATPPTSLGQFFKNFVILSRATPFLEVFMCYVFLCMKKNGNFLHFSVLCFFYQLASANSVQAIVVQFSTFCSSRLSFRLVFDNLLKNLIICLQHFDVLGISNRAFTVIPLVIEI